MGWRLRSGRRQPHSRTYRRSPEVALPPGQLLPGYDGPLGRGQRLVELVDPLHERPELEPPEHLLELRAVGRRQHELSRVAVDVEVAAHRRQHLRLAGLVGVLAQRPRAGGRQLVDVLEHALDGLELLDQLGGGLVTDAGHAGDRVGRVALEADQIGDLLRRHAEAGGDSLRRVHVHVGDPSRSHHQADVLGDELERVAVGGDDAGGHARLVGSGRQSGDHVVRLPAFELEVPVAESLDDRLEVRPLLAEQIGHRAAV